MFVNKTIQIRANLSRAKPSYRLCPSNEFVNGSWNIAVLSACFECNESLDIFGTISTNFCVNKRYSKDGQIESYQEPLATFHLQSDLNKTTKVIKNFNPVFLEINSLSGTKLIKHYFNIDHLIKN